MLFLGNLSRSQKKGRLYILALVFLLCLAAVLDFNQWASEPSSHSVLVASPIIVAAPSPGYQKISTAFFSTKVPNGWRIEQTPNPDNPERFGLLVLSSGTTDEQIAFVSDLLPDGGLSGVGDYNLRQTDTRDYTPIKNASFPPNSRAFQSQLSGINDTLFITNNGRYASISVNGNVASNVMSLLVGVIQAWQWK